MVNYFSPNQRLVLFALAAVDKELGPGPPTVAAIAFGKTNWPCTAI